MPVALSDILGFDAPFCVVIGNPIAHSLSPILHTTAARFHGLDLQYYAVNVDSAELGDLKKLFSHPHFLGANVTIPYKTKIREFLTDEDETAKSIGAVNTIVKQGSQLKGYNTDAYGFLKKLLPYKDRLKSKKAIVFGSGGASKAIVYGLDQLGMEEVVIISRKPDTNPSIYTNISERISVGSYQQLEELAKGADLFVNTTPLGMSPSEAYSPVPEGLEYILNQKICYDIVYRPLLTRFLQQGHSQDAILIDGLDMFLYQGDKAFHLWTGHHFPYDLVRKEVLEKLNQ